MRLERFHEPRPGLTAALQAEGGSRVDRRRPRCDRRAERARYGRKESEGDKAAPWALRPLPGQARIEGGKSGSRGLAAGREAASR